MRPDQPQHPAAARHAVAVALAISVLGTASIIRAGGATTATVLISLTLSMIAALLARSLLGEK